MSSVQYFILTMESVRESRDVSAPAFSHKDGEKYGDKASLMMEVCEDGGFFRGQTELLFAHLDALHKERHVATKGAHGL